MLARYRIPVTHTGTLSINQGPIQRAPFSISYLLDIAGFSISGTTENSLRAKLFTFGTIPENEDHIRGRAVTAIVDEVHLLCTLSCLKFSILPLSSLNKTVLSAFALPLTVLHSNLLIVASSVVNTILLFSKFSVFCSLVAGVRLAVTRERQQVPFWQSTQS